MIQHGPRTVSDPLFRTIVGTTVLVTTVHLAILPHWGPGPIVYPWFAPMTNGILALAALCVAVLALGRYYVLREPASYWIGAGFVVATVGFVFLVLSWPGFFPGGRAVIGHTTSTASHIGHSIFDLFGLCLLAGVLLRRPKERDLLGWRWPFSIAAWVALVTALCISLAAYDRSLPVAVRDDGSFTHFALTWAIITITIHALGAVFGTRRYLRTGDSLLGYLTFVQISIVFLISPVIFPTGKRLSLAFTIDRGIVLAAFLILLLALLVQHVELYRLEQEKTKNLARAQAAAHLGSWRWNILQDVVTWSEELYRVFGVDPKTFVPSNAAANALLHPDDRARHAEFVGIALTGKPVPPFESRIIRPNGEERIVVASGFEVVFDHSGKPITLFGTVLDITERKRAEQALKASETRYRELSHQLEDRVRQRTAELEAVNKELEAFSYSASHDLRAPLRTIEGFTQPLLASSTGLDEKGRHYLERIRVAAQRMRSLIDGLLLLSRTTRSQLEIKPVDLSELARAVIEDLRNSEPDRNVQLKIEPGLQAVGDPTLLQAAIQNLLGNAWKFTSRRDPAVIEFGLVNNRPNPAFFVRDNGAGFDMQRAEKLFTPFHRMHADVDFQGTGIGLATVQRIMRRHQGRIWAEAVPDQGATFYFELGTKPHIETKELTRADESDNAGV